MGFDDLVMCAENMLSSLFIADFSPEEHALMYGLLWDELLHIERLGGAVIGQPNGREGQQIRLVELCIELIQSTTVAGDLHACRFWLGALRQRMAVLRQRRRWICLNPGLFAVARAQPVGGAVAQAGGAAAPADVHEGGAAAHEGDGGLAAETSDPDVDEAVQENDAAPMARPS